MKLKVKDIDIATGLPLVAIVNKKDANKLDLYYEDRILIKKGKQCVVAITNISESNKVVSEGKIGLCEEVLKKINSKTGDSVNISIVSRPASLSYIRKKLNKGKLSYKEFYEIIQDIINNRLSQVETAYFVAACYTHELDLKESVSLTNAMVNTGETLKLKRYPVMDKHCIGGVAGNRTTMIVLPIVAAAGLAMPKTSSRSITSPAGTADTMEVLANVNLSVSEMKNIVEKINGCLVWGGSLNLAPADDKIIRVEHPLSLDPVGQLLASVLAKKKSVSATHLLIDIPLGKGAKIETRKKAMKYKKLFEEICKKLGIQVNVIITDGSQPIGNGIGPSLEARDVLWVLKNHPNQPYDLREKSLKMAGIMLEMGKKAKKGQGYKKALEILESGKAYEKMCEIIKAQGGKTINPENVKVGKLRYDFKAKKNGTILHIDNKSISKIARASGAPQSIASGVYIHKHAGQKVKKHEKIITIYSENRSKLNYAVDILEKINGIKVIS
ncbi:MAG: AMP phosphorylase [Candidatus Nanoarchaeia archaeon]|nr:AMP phosphorylase [Candidatus Nanoarchaeia archaeon]